MHYELRAHHHRLLLAAIDFDGEGLGQAYVAYVLRLLYGGQLVEDFLPVDAVASESVDGKVADAKRGKVLEEMRALARVNLEAVQSSLDDDLRGTDVAPLDGNAEPRVAASPTARTDEEVGSSPCPLLLPLLGSVQAASLVASEALLQRGSGEGAGRGCGLV